MPGMLAGAMGLFDEDEGYDGIQEYAAGYWGDELYDDSDLYAGMGNMGRMSKKMKMMRALNQRYKQSAGRKVDTSPFLITVGINGATALAVNGVGVRTNVYSYTLQVGQQLIFDPRNPPCEILFQPVSVVPAFINGHLEIMVQSSDGSREERIYDNDTTFMNPANNISANNAPRRWESRYTGVPGDVIRFWFTAPVALVVANSFITARAVSGRQVF